jgi:peroxiredoxin
MKKPQLFLAVLVLLATLSSFLLRLSAPGYQVGDSVADFKLKNVDGKLVSLADNKTAKGFIVVFTCNTCPYAQAYEQRIVALHQKYAPLGYPVVAINPNDPQVVAGDAYPEMQKRAQDKKYGFPYLVDETQSIARSYGATKTPHVFILTRSGADLKVAYIGAIDNNTEDANAATARYVEAALTDIMAGKAATTNSTKAVGCGIKWKKA